MKKCPVCLVLILILVAGGMSSCSKEPSLSGEFPRGDNQSRQAAAAFQAFFDHLSAGDYRQAAADYGGEYEVLRSYNPDTDPADRVALLNQACLSNGFQCLRVDEIIAVRENRPGDWLITASFLTDQGRVFSRGPCCVAGEEDQPAESEFTFRVRRDPSGEYLVMDLPVYVP